MAKDYAIGFYHSKEWTNTQAAYMASRNYICERCGEPARIVHHKIYITPGNISDLNITLNWDNLEALCQTCHNQEHIRTSALAEGLAFDSSGNLVKI